MLSTLSYNTSTLLLYFLLFSLLSILSSEWIESLYRKQPDTLSYPAEKNSRSWYRKPFLSLALTALLLFCQSLPLSLLAYKLILFYFLLLTICTDLEQQVIFDRMLLPFALLALPMLSLLHLPFVDHLLAAVAGGAAFLLLAIVTGGGIGGGDIKLIFVLGLWLGTQKLLSVAMIGFFLGGFIALLLLLTGRKKRGEYFAYGPCFAVVAIFFTLF